MNKLFSLDTLIIILFALCLGLFIGRVPKIQIMTGTFFHNIYVQFHPDTQKDTKTIIMEKASQNLSELPQKSIFDEPPRKENTVICIIKRIFTKNQPKKQTIHDCVLN